MTRKPDDSCEQDGSHCLSRPRRSRAISFIRAAERGSAHRLHA
jgi:hypothetical protein